MFEMRGHNSPQKIVKRLGQELGWGTGFGDRVWGLGLGTGIGDWDWGLGWGMGNWERGMGKWEIDSTSSPRR